MTPYNYKEVVASQQNQDQEQEAIASVECCMCGDYGVLNEIFRCRICLFRSQHRYCSNQYPKAQSYELCNWCLINDTKEIKQNSSNGSSSTKNKNNENNNQGVLSTKKSQTKLRQSKSGNNLQNLVSQVNGNSSQIKKQLRPSPERLLQLPSTISSRRTSGRLLVESKNHMIRRTKSDIDQILNRNKSINVNNNDYNNGKEQKHVVFRNKVRRYKLLDEVSS